MVNMETTYMGLTLKNPIIVSSSGLTNSVDKIEKLANEGAGAVILKSLFEEQILAEAGHALKSAEGDYPEAADYVTNYVRSQSISNYIKLIKGAKEKTDIPVIASINCFSAGEWIDFTKTIEEAGADALELNIFMLNTDLHTSPDEYTQQHIDIVRQVKAATSLPISVKISPYFSDTLRLIDLFKSEGVQAVTLFNRFYQPDIDIKKLEVSSADVFSNPADIHQTLRWTSLASGCVPNIDISASTGVHDWEGAVKLLLAGASTIQLCTVLYKESFSMIPEIITCIDEWMTQKNFTSIADFKGSLNYKNVRNPSLYERSQFMKYFSSKE